MKRMNPWKSLFCPSRRRLRRRPREFSVIESLAAQVLEVRQLLAAVPNVTLTTAAASGGGTDVTLSSSDINNPNVTITRSGNFVVFTGANGTQITYTNNGTTGTTQTIAIATVASLTINLGTGADSFTVAGLAVTGNMTINGQSSGSANMAINAAATDITIGGSINANFGSEEVAFSVFGSFNPGNGGGGNLTVNGAVNVTEAGSGNKQVNLAGPPANNSSGGLLTVKGAVSVTDSGNGTSGLRIDDGVTIGGNVSFDNSANTVNGDTVQIFSNSNAFGVTSIGGTLNLALSNAVYNGDTVLIQGFGSKLAVTGAVTIAGNAGADTIQFLNDLFKSTVSVNAGGSPSFSPDTVVIQGSQFNAAANVTMSGAYAQLGLGTDSNFGPTTFNGNFTASMTGASASAFLSNGTSSSSEVIFNSAARFTGGSPAGTLIEQGRFTAAAGLTLTNFTVGTPPAITARVNLTTAASTGGTNVTLTSTDINNPNVTVSRSGSSVVFTGINGTLITFTNNGSTGSTQTLTIPTVNNLTINLGTGNDSFTVAGIGMAGNVTITGQSSGAANVAINAAATSITIGGSINANFGNETVAFSVFGSFNPGFGGGGNLTVGGSVNVTEAGNGNKQVNVFGPPANNASGGKLAIHGGVTVIDSGNGTSGLRIDDGVTIGGNVSFNNSANTVNADTVQIFSNSSQFGVTSIAGTLSLNLSNAVYNGDTVLMQGFGSKLPVTGNMTIHGNAGGDTIQFRNILFKGAATIDAGGSPDFIPDVIVIQGSQFNGAVQVTTTGAFSQLGLGTDSSFGPTIFNNTFAASMTGPSATVFLSNPISGSNEVIFNSTVHLTGGTPPGTLVEQGKFFIGAGKLTLTNFVTNLSQSQPQAPTLTSIALLGSPIESVPFNIPYSTLLAASNAADSNGASIQFRITSLQNGTLSIIHNGVTSPVVPGLGTGTLFGPGDTLVWTPPASAGNINAFSVDAFDGVLDSSSPVPVTINVKPPPPDISGVWSSSVGGFDTISQSGTDLSFLNQGGFSSTGTFISGNTITGFGLTGTVDTTTPDNGRILWSNGRIWLRISLGGDWAVASGGSTTLGSIAQSGTVLTFDGPAGNNLSGTLVTPTQATMTLGNMTTLTGTLTNGTTITFSDGEVWTKLDLAPNYITSAGGGGTQVVQNGTTTLGFVNSQSESFSGNFTDPTDLVTTTAATGFPIGTTATIGGGQIAWSTGETWSESLTVYGTNPSGATISLTVTPSLAFIINASGQVSRVDITSPTTLSAIDGASAGLTATRTNGGIQWSNGTFWSNFDFDALNAAFASNITSGAATILTGTNPSGLAVSIISTASQIWISNASGQLMHVQITSATTLVVTDGPNTGLTGTRSNGTITWANNVVWSNFNAAALAALFSNVPHYPFPP
jgi:hypothetical protein